MKNNFNEEKNNLSSSTNEKEFNNNLLLCNKCFCIPKVDINPYNHKITTLCQNNHQINPMPLDLYLKEELNKNIICSICNKNNNNLLYCKNCLIILCQNCLKNHNSYHQIINFSDINILCLEHQAKINNICLTCNKEICQKCLESEHIHHKTQFINEFLNNPDNNIDINLKKVLSNNIFKERKQIEIINDMLIKKINKFTQIKNIENQINQKILNTNEIYPYNLNSIYNINNMINNSNISEENYYEIVSNITCLLENYFTNGNNGNEKLILIKRKNLKNIFFLILFLVLVIIATYFFGDFITYGTSNKNIEDNENENKIIFNNNSNLLKLTEIIITEEQENKINNYILKSISSIIEQYDNIFNNNQNKNYNISLNYKLIYKGSRDGDTINSFHKRCDNKNNLLFVIETLNKTKFGFFSLNGYKNLNDKNNWIKDINLFLFKFSNDNKNITFYKNINNDCGLYWHHSSIIELKEKDKLILYIPNNFFHVNNFGSTCRKDTSFNITEDFELNNGFEKFALKDIEVFHVIFKYDN